MDTEDYYSYKPLVKLPRPVALVGLPGCRAMQTARVAVMITGLGVVLLPRQVAHRCGMDPEGLLLGGRDAELHEAEHALLTDALKKRSPPVIALGPTTLENPDCRALLVANTDIVYLHQTLEESLAALQAEMAEDRRKHQHLRREGPITHSGLRPLFAQRTQLFRRVCTQEIPVKGRGPLSLGRELPTILGW